MPEDNPDEDMPDWALKRLADVLLPVMLNYFETDEGKQFLQSTE